jgi:hypothetical protein
MNTCDACKRGDHNDCSGSVLTIESGEEKRDPNMVAVICDCRRNAHNGGALGLKRTER